MRWLLEWIEAAAGLVTKEIKERMEFKDSLGSSALQEISICVE